MINLPTAAKDMVTALVWEFTVIGYKSMFTLFGYICLCEQSRDA